MSTTQQVYRGGMKATVPAPQRPSFTPKQALFAYFAVLSVSVFTAFIVMVATRGAILGFFAFGLSALISTIVANNVLKPKSLQLVSAVLDQQERLMWCFPVGYALDDAGRRWTSATKGQLYFTNGRLLWNVRKVGNSIVYDEVRYWTIRSIDSSRPRRIISIQTLTGREMFRFASEEWYQKALQLFQQMLLNKA